MMKLEGWYGGFFWGIVSSTIGLGIAGFILNEWIIYMCALGIDISGLIPIIIKPKNETKIEYPDGFWS